MIARLISPSSCLLRRPERLVVDRAAPGCLCGRRAAGMPSAERWKRRLWCSQTGGLLSHRSRGWCPRKASGGRGLLRDDREGPRTRWDPAGIWTV